jgi:hypothetical protein
LSREFGACPDGIMSIKAPATPIQSGGCMGLRE